MPKPDGSLSAVVVSGGKQYRVAPGDRILVDRMAAEPGSSVKLGVLLINDGKEIKVGNPAVAGVDVEAKVIAHDRGPRVESIRYKPKKRVRVHRGGRAHLTALEIIAVGGVPAGAPAREGGEGAKEESKPEGRSKGAAKKKAAATKAEAAAETEEPKAEKPKRTSRRSKKESE